MQITIKTTGNQGTAMKKGDCVKHTNQDPSLSFTEDCRERAECDTLIVSASGNEPCQVYFVTKVW